MSRTVLTAYGRECIEHSDPVGRSHLFGLALRSAGLTMAAFIDRYLDAPAAESAVYGVAAGRRTSARISKAIDRLIQDEGPRVTRAFATYRQAA